MRQELSALRSSTDSQAALMSVSAKAIKWRQSYDLASHDSWIVSGVCKQRFRDWCSLRPYVSRVAFLYNVA